MRDIIHTARLTLRPFTLADAARVCELIGNFEVSKMLSRPPHPYSLDDAMSWLGTHQDLRSTGTDFPFAITTTADGVIGAIGLHATTRLSDIAPDAFELGYWLGQPFWGQGYATEAGVGVLAAFDADMPNKSIVSGHFTENPQSGHVLEKLGFQYVGGPGTIFCVARRADVPDMSMLRTAQNQSDPDRSLLL